MMRQLLFVALGGAAGSVLRFLCQRAFNGAFPYGTLIVNIVGCLLIGILFGLLQKHAVSASAYLLLATGFCGGFTTFSAFSQESLLLLTQQRWPVFLFYVVSSVAASLLATFAGYKLIH